MATVTAFRIDGIELWFWSHDHEPPHFHAKKKGEWEYRVWFMEQPTAMLDRLWTQKRMPRSIRKQLVELAESHRSELLQQWQQIQGM